MAELFILLSIILIFTTVLSIFSKFLKQPLVLAYILTGILLGPVFGTLTPSETLTTFAHIGAAFLLFSVGLNLNFRVLREVGALSLILGIGQVLFTAIIGYFVILAFGFTPISALYISIALTFSSTIIIIKLLTDKNDLDTFYGRIAVGLLIVQDLIALLILLFITGIQTQTANTGLFTILKGLLFAGFIIAAAKIILPPVFRFVSRSQEQLFLTGISWCLFLAAGASFLGFNLEIGAFLAGLSLATLPYAAEINSKTLQLRDFFLVIFFVNLGLQMNLPSISTILLPAIILSLFVLIGNPLIIMTLVGILGYRKRIGFLVGLTVAQISEFSLILIALGMSVGHIPAEAVNLVTLVGIITITLSTYMIIYSEHLYRFFEKYLTIFEKKKTIQEFITPKATYDTILIGCNRLGSQILDYLHKTKHKCLVIDYNPDVIQRLQRKHIPVIYGDASDAEILNLIDTTYTKILISTTPNVEETKALLHHIKKTNKKIITIVTTSIPQEAIELYREGASYVITPHLLSAEIVTHTLQDVLEKRKSFKPLRIKHLKNLTRFISF